MAAKLYVLHDVNQCWSGFDVFQNIERTRPANDLVLKKIWKKNY